MRSVASIIAAMALSTAADAASIEGHVGDLRPVAVVADRKSNYEGESTPIVKSAAVLDQKAEAIAPQKRTRPTTVRKSQKASYFYFYDAHGSLQADRDGDGYHSEFTVRFDADTTLGDELVYAKLYLRRLGESDWILYHVTDDFWINGESNDDDFYVRTTLDDGIATSEYDVLVDLYQSSTDEVVATIDYTDAGELGLLPLEEAGLDVPIQEPGFAIEAVQTTLLVDDDQDGHYSKFKIAFDPQAELQPGYLYARVWIRPQGGEWTQEHVSEDFPADTSGQNDAYAFTVDWVSGYPTAYYDVQIDLYDASTDLLVASAGSERADLSQLPLEGRELDQKVSAPVSGGGPTVTSHEHGGGGALQVGWIALLALIAYLRGVRAGPLPSRVD